MPSTRCGSLACPPCARAYQKALVAAERKLWKALGQERPDEQRVFVTIIPKGMTYLPGQFTSINMLKANRYLKDVLRRCGLATTITGSVDFEWDERRGGQYLQVHWHLTLLTEDPRGLEKELKKRFPRSKAYERAVKVKVAINRKFLPYVHKIIKLPDLLRGARKVLPEILLRLDGMDPLDPLVLMGVRLSAQRGQLRMAKIGQTRR